MLFFRAFTMAKAPTEAATAALIQPQKGPPFAKRQNEDPVFDQFPIEGAKDFKTSGGGVFDLSGKLPHTHEAAEFRRFQGHVFEEHDGHSDRQRENAKHQPAVGIAFHDLVCQVEQVGRQAKQKNVGEKHRLQHYEE